MEFGTQQTIPYALWGHLGYGGYMPTVYYPCHYAQVPNSSVPNLATLRTQSGYLEDLLSKTAMTLYALRGRQTRNERALATNPTPRSKRKKIAQNKWRTDKTIKTCENEERVLLDCLRVCRNNIHTLEAMMNPTQAPSWGGCNWSTSQSYVGRESDSSITEFDWNGWADKGQVSPFQRKPRRPAMVDDVPPEMILDLAVVGAEVMTRILPPELPPRPHSPSPGPPPHTARSQCSSSLSPTAKAFEPSVTHNKHDRPRGEELLKEFDKLSISGLLASKRHRRLQADQLRRFSDAAIGHLFRRLSSTRYGALRLVGRRHTSCGPETRHINGEYDAAGANLRRMMTA